MEKTIAIKSAEIVKEGETNGKKWTMIKLVDSDDLKYKGFERELLQGIGRSAIIVYSEEKKNFTNDKGKSVDYIERFIKSYRWSDSPVVENKPKSGTGQRVITLESLQGQIDDINKRLSPEQPF